MEREVFIYACVLFAVLGLCVGSFLNVVIYRLPNGMSLSKPSSHCTNCDYSLRWYDNIPVLSYIMLGGKCRKCKQKISPRYMIVEIVNCLLWLICAFLFAREHLVYAICVAILCSTLICVFFIDLEHMLIYDRFQLIILCLGVVAIFFAPNALWYNHLIGGLVGGGVFLLLYYGAIWILKKEGLGFGDVKLAFVTGLFLGWQKFLLSMIIASISACIVLLIIKSVKKDEDGKEYPFGPFIAVGVLIATFVGDPLITFYLGLF